MDEEKGQDELPDKRDVARGLLLRGSLFVHLDPRQEGVLTPAWLGRQPQLVLQLGLDLAIPIPDLKIEEDGISATLSFSRTPFTCVVPWHAIFALVGDDGKGMVWPEDMPPEIAREVDREAGRQEAPAPAPIPAPEPGLAEVTPLLGREPRAKRPSKPKGRGASELPSYLRVIK